MELTSDTNKPKNITISKSKITNINIIIKKWILKEFWILPTLINPLSKALIFNKSFFFTLITKFAPYNTNNKNKVNKTTNNKLKIKEQKFSLYKSLKLFLIFLSYY